MGLVDGPGIRTVIFLDGCPLRCLYCHNPEMWNINKLNKYEVKDIISILLKNKTYYASSNGGVTFSGGEPLLQEDFLIELLKECKKEKIHTALDTSGFYKSEDKLNIILDLVDLVILDIKHTDESNYQKITGQSMETVNKFIDICNKHQKNVWIRSVIVPGINDNANYIEELNEYIKRIKNIKNIELIPYHSMAKEKYQELNIKYVLNDIKEIDLKKFKELEKHLKKLLTVKS